jgi:hypothetical protein
MKEKEEKEELTEEQVITWLKDHKKIFFRFEKDPKYCVLNFCPYDDPSEYTKYNDDIPFEQKFKVGQGCGVWYTRIESTPYNYTMKNPYDKYYTIFYSYRDPQLIELEKENEKFKEEMKKKSHTHWWK